MATVRRALIAEAHQLATSGGSMEQVATLLRQALDAGSETTVAWPTRVLVPYFDEATTASPADPIELEPDLANAQTLLNQVAAERRAGGDPAAKLARVTARAGALLGALPRCEGCYDARATCESMTDFEVFCDDCGAPSDPGQPDWTEPLGYVDEAAALERELAKAGD